LLDAEDEVRIEGLDDASARTLVDTVAGSRTNVWSWTPDLRETIRRPFFALAAGSLISAGEVPTGQVDLVSRLSRLALRRVPSSGAYDVLVRAGAVLTESNGVEDGLSFAQRQLALTTRLVSYEANERVSFTLPIFQQWFAAQALSGGAWAIETVLTSPTSFDRWRWAIAIAALDVSADTGDDLVATCFEMNPGAGAWVVQQVSAGRHRWRASEEPPLDPTVAPARLLRATRTWVDAIGPLAPLVLPLAEDAPIRLGVRVEGNRLTTGWSTPSDHDEVVELPDHVHPLGGDDPDWRAWHSGGVPDGDLWPWTMVREDIARQTSRMLDGRRRLGPPDGVWHQERRYLVARTILRKGSVFQPPLDRAEIIDAAQELLAAVDEPSTTLYHLGAKRVGGDEIIDLRDWLEKQEFTAFARPVPGADLTKPTGGGMVWDVYSPERMALFCAEMLGLACQAYDELVHTVLPSFGWALGRNAFSPVGAIGAVTYQENGIRGYRPTLQFSSLPMELMNRDVAASQDLVVSTNGRGAVRLGQTSDDADRLEHATQHSERLDQWAIQSGIDSPFRSLGGRTSTVVECAHNRPASLQAAHWVWDDLKRLSLASGTSPRLGS